VSVETVERELEVAAFVAVILAPTTAAPEESTTEPLTLPVCARKMEGVLRIAAIVKRVAMP
jgi:hypothetical protein